MSNEPNQDKSDRRVVITIVAIIALISIAACGGLFTVTFLLARHAPQLLDQRVAAGPFPEPRVYTQDEPFLQEAVFDDARLGLVTDIAVRDLDGNPGDETAIVGIDGALFVGDGHRFVAFPRGGSYLVLTGWNNDEGYAFLDRGGLRPGRLISPDGAVQWVDPEHNDFGSVAAGDMEEGDGRYELLAASNGEINLYDDTFTQVWKHAALEPWGVEFIDINRDGAREAYTISRRGEIRAYDLAGDSVLDDLSTPFDISNYNFCRWPDRDSPTMLIVQGDDMLYIMDLEGNVHHRYEGENLDAAHEVWGAPVRFHANAAPYFAIVTDMVNRRGPAANNRGMVSIFNAENQLVYQIVLDERCASIAVRPAEDGEAELLWVGSQNRVWEFKPEPTP